MNLLEPIGVVDERLGHRRITAATILSHCVKTRLSRARAALRRELSAQTDAVASNSFRFLRPRCDRVVAAVLAAHPLTDWRAMF